MAIFVVQINRVKTATGNLLKCAEDSAVYMEWHDDTRQSCVYGMLHNTIIDAAHHGYKSSESQDQFEQEQYKRPEHCCVCYSY